MPLIAIDEKSGERVSTWRNAKKNIPQDRDYTCPSCGGLMFLRGGADSHYRLHWVHVGDVGCSGGGGGDSTPESPEHIAAKYAVLDLLVDREKEAGYSLKEGDVEVPIGSRVADVHVATPMGWREVHEIQLSGISVREVVQRTEDYRNAKVQKVVWYVGPTFQERHIETMEANGLEVREVRFSKTGPYNNKIVVRIK